MTATFSMEDLDGRLDLLPVFSGKDESPLAYVHEDDMSFNGNFETYLKALKRNGVEYDVYRRCQASSRKAGVSVYAHLSSFRQTDTGWETSLQDAYNTIQREKAHTFRDNNLPFLRKYSQGDENEPIHCSLTGQRLDAWEMIPGLPINIWEQHHFLVWLRSSVQKESEDPGSILRRMDFGVPSGQTVEAIKDMMRTIFLSPTAHKAVHNTWSSSDITNYTVEQRPWALRSQENWNTWMNWLEAKGYSEEHFGSFTDWLESLKH